MALFTVVQRFVPSIQSPTYQHSLPNVWKASDTISASIFVDVPYWPPYSTDKFISCVVPVPSQRFFHFGEEIVFAWTHIAWVHRCRSGGSMRASHGFDPRSGQVSWVRFFRGFSSLVRQMSGSFRSPRSPNIIWPPLSSTIIHYGRQWPEMLTRPQTSNIHTYQVSKVDVPESPIASVVRGLWLQQRCDSLHCHEEWWASVPPSASHSPWKHSCVLQPPATSILIKERCSSFVNMVLGRSHYSYESQRSTHCSSLTEYCHRLLH